MLVRVLYVSEIGPTVSTADIDRLVANARRRNRQLDLTGALLVCDGHFAQVLEGREVSVEEMMRRISMDVRHHSLRVQDRSLISRRLFADWDMAYINDLRCKADVDDLVKGGTSIEAFLSLMAGWVEEHKTGQF